MKSPNVWVNWLQFVTSVGRVGRPAGGQADERGDGVPTPSIGRDPASTSST